MTKNRKSHGGIERCRNSNNLYLSLPDARPVPVKVDPLQADVGATKWVAPSSLSAPPSAGAPMEGAWPQRRTTTPCRSTTPALASPRRGRLLHRLRARVIRPVDPEGSHSFRL